MKARILLLAFLISLFLNATQLSTLQAEESQLKTVVELNKIVVEENELELQKQSKIIQVITKADLEKTKASTLIEALTSILGGNVSSYGKYQKGAVYLKGNSSHASVILLNGIKLVDVSSGSFDIGQILLTAIEKIEIISGNESIAYGSEATGGAINIITKQADSVGGSQRTEINAEYGSYNTYTTGLTSAIVGEGHKRIISVNFNGSNGYSTSFGDNQNRKNNGDKDRYDSGNGFLGYNIKTASIGEFDFGINVSYAKVNYDPFASLPSPLCNGRPCGGPAFPYFYLKDTSGAYFEKQSFLLYTKYNVKAFGLKHLINISYYANYKKDYEDFIGMPYLEPKNNKHISVVGAFNYSNNWQIIENSKIGSAFLISGVDVEIERLTQEISSRYTRAVRASFGLNKTTLKENKFAYFTSLNYNPIAKLNVNLGARGNHSDYYREDIKSNYNLGITYLGNNYKLRSNGFVAYKNPNLFELYDYDSGALIDKKPENFTLLINNNKLKQEQNKGFDIGGDLYLLDSKLTLSTTYFYNYIKNLIILKYSVENARYYGEPQRTYTNRDDGVAIQGVLFNSKYDVNQYFDVSLGYNYTYFNKNLPRRPKHTGTLGLSAKYAKFSSHIDIVAVSQNLDGFDIDEYKNTKTPIKNKIGDWYAKGYIIANLTSQYNFNQNFNTYLKVNNILNKKYQPAYAFAGEPLGFYVGINFKY